MRREFQTVASGEMLETAFARLRACDCHTAPVVDAGALVGLLTMENVGEFIAVQTALKTAAGSGAGRPTLAPR
jgi:predicted transcriptional regulator